jgi:protoporphyrinogen/coproporphyrinogen III oxidase
VPSIAVVGGGLAGLTAAYALQMRGAQVVLFESGDRVGGRMVTDLLDGVPVDSGAQLFGSMYERFLALVREIGLGSQVVRVPGRDALWRDGRPHEVVYGSVASMIASGGLPFRTKLRLGSSYVPFLARHSEGLDLHAPERAAEAGLDDEDIATWGEREIDISFVASLVYPQLGAYYGSLPRETSAGFYHILAHYGMEVVLYAIAGGTGIVTERLAELVRSGGEIRTGVEVTGLELGGGSGVILQTAAGGEPFDAAISAVPAPILRKIGRRLPEPLERWLGGVRYRPSLSMALLLDRPTGPRYFGLSFPEGEMSYVSAIALQENKGVDLVPPGRGLLLVVPTPEAAPELIGMESRGILDRMLPEVTRAFPDLPSHVQRARVYRWPVGMPTMYPGYLQHLGMFRSGEPEGTIPLALAGDYLYSPSAEGAVTSALHAVDRLLARLS